MKLKLIAAAALAALSLPSFAAIQTNDDAELVLIVFDGSASYAKDLGITINDVSALSGGVNGYSFSLDLSTLGGDAWTQFLGADGALAAGTQWAIVGTDLNPPISVVTSASHLVNFSCLVIIKVNMLSTEPPKTRSSTVSRTLNQL